MRVGLHIEERVTLWTEKYGKNSSPFVKNAASLNQSSEQFLFPVTGKALMTDFKNMNDDILIVDDQKETRDVLSKLLVYMGYNVVSAGSGKEGLEILSESTFNLVIADSMMPGVDASTFAVSLKKRSPRTPIILITEKGSDAVQKAPVDFVMYKPFTLMDLENTVRMFLGE